MDNVDYHLMISRLLYQFLERIAGQYNRTVNMLVRKFVELTIQHIDLLYQSYGRQTRAVYESVNFSEPLTSLPVLNTAGGALEGNVDIHILFSRDTLYRLKWLQGNFNLFSMAQVVRKCIFFVMRMIKEYGTLGGAIRALNGMDEAIEEFEDSKDERGFIKFQSGIRHMAVNSVVSYGIIALYIRFMKFMLFGLPLDRK